MEKIEVVFITRNMVINGISSVIMSYCENIDVEKFNISIISGKPVDRGYLEKLSLMGINVYEIPEKRKKPIESYINLYKILNQNKFAITHIHGNSRTIVVELLLSKLAGARVRIAHSHSTSCDHKLLHNIFKVPFSALYTRGIACSYEAGKWMFGDKDFTVIQNGINVTSFLYNEKKRIRLREKMGLHDSFVIGHVGRFIEAKNHKFILEIFKEVVDMIPNAKLLLIGEGPLKHNIIDKSKELGIFENIIFFGTTNKTMDIYNAMDVMLLPSVYEGLGIVALEAQINGLPVLCSDNVPVITKISDGIEYINLDNTKDWLKQINDICTRNKRMNNLIENKVDLIDSKMIVKSLEKIYYNEYDGILGENNKRF